MKYFESKKLQRPKLGLRSLTLIKQNEPLPHRKRIQNVLRAITKHNTTYSDASLELDASEKELSIRVSKVYKKIENLV